MPNEFDLIVVGAGPAGASCALYAARAGLRVLLLDRARFPRDKVCGDFVPRRAQRCLEELGLLHRLLAAPHVRLSHLRLVAPSGAAVTLPFCPAQAKPPGYAAYVCRRWHLDALLVEAAREVAAVREGFAVTHVLRDGQAVVGVRGHGEGTPEESFAARLVVGADGHRSVLRRQLGLYRLEPRHWAAAARAYYRGVDMDPSTAEVHFLPWVRSGYLWLFPADDGLTNVGLGVRQHELRRQGRGLRQALAAALETEPLAARFSRARAASPVLGWPLPLGSRRRQVHGPGFLLVGDAAGLVNPFSGEGIGNAMWSGRLAAQSAAGGAAGAPTTAALRGYATRLWRDLGPELRLARQLQRLGRYPSLLNLVLGRAARRPEVGDWLGLMLCGQVSKAALLSPLTYLRLLAR